MDMELNELKSFSRLALGGLLIAGPYLSFGFTFQPNHLYDRYILIMGAGIAVICIMNLILTFFDSQVIKSIYLGCGTACYFVCYSLYLSVAANKLLPQNRFSQWLLLLNPVIMFIPILFKRLILKRPAFVNALKSKKHLKYLISDLILAAALELAVILVSIRLDQFSMEQTISSVSDALVAFIVYCLIAASTTAYVYGLTFYTYEARFRTFQSKPKARR